MKILGIETSCDETSASVVEDGRILLSNVIASSMDLHKTYGGVVPEIAARSHIESVTPVINQALLDANCGWDDISAIAVTKGPGLGGSLLVGVLSARTLAIIKNKPLYGIDHVKAHVFANFITSSPLKNYKLPQFAPKFPALALIVSGGHTQLALFDAYSRYKLLGTTTDDAVGEAFDKVAKILGLEYPGGPSIAKEAVAGNPTAYKLPKAKLKDKYDFSFSGLKTALLRLAQKEIGEDFNFPSHQIHHRLTKKQRADLAASFQKTAIDTLIDKLMLAQKEFSPKSIVIAGGVASNQYLRTTLENLKLPFTIYTDPKLCTDNGAMIAVAGFFAHQVGQTAVDPYSLEIDPGLSM